MTVVQETGVNCLHTVHHHRVAVLFRSGKVFVFSGELIGIGQNLVNASVFRVENALHCRGIVLCYEIYRPVAHLQEHRAGLFVLTIYICVAQTGHHLVLHIQGHIAASTVECRRHIRPQVVVGISSDVAVKTFRVAVERILTVFHHTDHIIHTFLQLSPDGIVVTCSIGQRKGREIVTAHMAVQTERTASPVVEVGMQGCPVLVNTAVEPGLTYERCQESVYVVGHQHLDVEIHRRLQRSLRECHLGKLEVFRIETVFTLGTQREHQS